MRDSWGFTPESTPRDPKTMGTGLKFARLGKNRVFSKVILQLGTWGSPGSPKAQGLT